MTEHSSCSFNFNEAAAMAKEFYPEQTLHTHFFDFSRPDAADKLLAFYIPIAANGKPPSPELIDCLKKIIVKHMKEEAMAADHDEYGKILGSRSVRQKQIIFKDPVKDSAYAFWHEFGHLLLPGAALYKAPAGMTELEFVNGKENKADVFATIFCLTHGIISKQDVREIIEYRYANAGTSLDFAHLTAPALEEIYEAADDLIALKLAPAEILNIANDHAGINRLSNSVLQPARALMHVRMGEEMAKVGDQIKRTSDTPYAEEIEIWMSHYLYLSELMRTLPCTNIVQKSALAAIGKLMAGEFPAPKPLANFMKSKKMEGTAL